MCTNDDIPKADGFTPKVIKDTNLDMGIALPKYGDGPKFYKVKKRLQYSNDILIGRACDNPILDTIVYEVEYLCCTLALNVGSYIYCINLHTEGG